MSSVGGNVAGSANDVSRMPDATENQYEPSTAAFQELSGNLEYARDLVRGGRHLQRLEVHAFDVADLYRAAWVQAVSALDHWVHRELYDRALGLALNVEEPRPPRFFDLRLCRRRSPNIYALISGTSRFRLPTRSSKLLPMSAMFHCGRMSRSIWPTTATVS